MAQLAGLASIQWPRLTRTLPTNAEQKKKRVSSKGCNTGNGHSALQVTASQTLRALKQDLLPKLTLMTPKRSSAWPLRPSPGLLPAPTGWGKKSRGQPHEGQQTLPQRSVDSSIPAAPFVPSISSPIKVRMGSQVSSALPSSSRVFPGTANTPPAGLTLPESLQPLQRTSHRLSLFLFPHVQRQ